jgi:hypothetical protein
MENVDVGTFEVTVNVPRQVYVPSNVIVWSAVRTAVSEEGAVQPGTGANVISYDPTGAFTAKYLPSPA